jgi:hypothetical protein
MRIGPTTGTFIKLSLDVGRDSSKIDFKRIISRRGMRITYWQHKTLKGACRIRSPPEETSVSPTGNTKH